MLKLRCDMINEKKRKTSRVNLKWRGRDNCWAKVRWELTPGKWDGPLEPKPHYCEATLWKFNDQEKKREMKEKFYRGKVFFSSLAKLTTCQLNKMYWNEIKTDKKYFKIDFMIMSYRIRAMNNWIIWTIFCCPPDRRKLNFALELTNQFTGSNYYEANNEGQWYWFPKCKLLQSRERC